MKVDRIAMLLAAGLLLLAGCGEGDRPEAGPSPTTTFEDVTTVSPGTAEWLAVFETAEDVNDLEDIQDEILDEAAEHVAVAAAGCWDEVPEQLGIEEDHYVAGVVAASPEELRDVVDDVGRDPIFEGKVTLIACQ
jgi:hypothetical protein